MADHGRTRRRLACPQLALGLPFLVAKLRDSWSGSTRPLIENEQQFRPSALAPLRGPVSSSSYSSRAAAVKQQEDGGAGEGEALLDEVLAILGADADRDEFRGLITGRNPHPTIPHSFQGVRSDPRSDCGHETSTGCTCSTPWHLPCQLAISRVPMFAPLGFGNRTSLMGRVPPGCRPSAAVSQRTRVQQFW